MHEPSRDNRHEPPVAAHLVSPRGLYTHHGIYVGGGRVVHYAGFVHGWRRGAVEVVSIESFSGGRSVLVLPDVREFDPDEVVARACSRLGERDYRLMSNNCEHLCAWSLRGEWRSGQVDRLLSWPRRLAGLFRRCARRTLRCRWNEVA